MRRLILPPASREARNEQWKLRAALINALSITLIVTGLFGPYINPSSLGGVSVAERLMLVAMGAVLHIFATFLVRAIEDKV
jgi:putative exporter of polyketide antibiotics